MNYISHHFFLFILYVLVLYIEGMEGGGGEDDDDDTIGSESVERFGLCFIG